MISLSEIFENTYVKIFIIIALLAIIIWLVYTQLNEPFADYSYDRLPPHIEKLPHTQLVPQDPSITDKIILNDNSSENSSESSENKEEFNDEFTKMEKIDVPNYHRTNELNTIKNTRMKHGNIYRMNTGRDAYQQEYFVNIYDSNFGGLLGTNMGTNVGT